MPHADTPKPLCAAPCRFCGERAWLTQNPAMVEDFYAHHPDGSLVMDGDEPKLHTVDFIECLICGATAPVALWNGATVTPEMRAALIAEYMRGGSREPQIEPLPQAA